MTLIINGETKTFDTKLSILEIMKELSIEGKVMATAVNMEIVKQDDWANYRPNDGDKLEMLDFVGGG